MENAPKSPSDSPPGLQTGPAKIIATGFGLGFLPKAPGTWASLAALPPAWFISQQFGPIGLGIAAFLALILGIWASSRIETLSGKKDPSSVVIDEIAGQWIALIAIPPDFILYAAGFILFRLADIFKPWPVSWAESLPGGFGVMMDDVFAGIYAGLGTYLIAMWF